MPNLLDFQPQTMTSREIAELTGKTHFNVLRDIDNILKTLNSDLKGGFKSTTYVDGTGKSNRQFDMDRDSVYCLMAGYDVNSRMRIIKRWQELEAKQDAALPDFSDPAAAAEAWAFEYRAKREALREAEVAKEATLASNRKTETLQVELDQSMEWFSIKRIAQHNGVSWRDVKWQPLKRHGLSNNLTPRKVFDANYGSVNTYHEDSWGAAYPQLLLPGRDN